MWSENYDYTVVITWYQLLHTLRPTGRFFAHSTCLLYTSDAADERSSVDLGGRRIIKKKESTISRLTREVECAKKRPVGLKVWRSWYQVITTV